MARGAVLLSVIKMMSLGEGGDRFGAILPCETPISRLSDDVPPYTASRAAESLVSTVKLPKPRPLSVTSKTSDPPLGPGMTWELLLLLTKTRGGLLDGDAHKEMDMVSWEEDGNERRRGVEEVEKLFAERERGVSRERVGWVLCEYTQGRVKNKTRGQNILGLAFLGLAANRFVS